MFLGQTTETFSSVVMFKQAFRFPDRFLSLSFVVYGVKYVFYVRT